MFNCVVLITLLRVTSVILSYIKTRVKGDAGDLTGYFEEL